MRRKMTRRMRRQLDFITGILSAVAVFLIFWEAPLLWFSMKDNAAIAVWAIGNIIAYIAACTWEGPRKKKIRKPDECQEEFEG